MKKTGGWTKQMFEVIKMAGYTEGELGRGVKVVVEGPYGVFRWTSVCLAGY